MPPPPQTPGPTDIVSQIFSASRGAVLVAEPAFVMSYNPQTQRAICQPILHNYYTATNDDGVNREFQQPIPDVPVAWPVCSSGGMVGTLSPGDRVILLVCGRSLDEWKATNAADIQQQDKRRHAFTDAVAFPLTITALQDTQYAAGALVISGADVRMGSSAAVSPVALSVPTDDNNAVVWSALTAIATAADFVAAQAAIGILLGLHPSPTPTGATLVKAL